MKRIASWWVTAVSLLLLMVSPMTWAQSASDFSHGATVSAELATLWFAPSGSDTSWVDIHYQHNGGDQQNLRMNYNAGSSRYETTIGPVVGGDQIDYWFTYNKGDGAYDSGHTAYVVGGDGGTTPSPSIGSWDGKTSFELVNNTNGAWSDDNVYWAIIGRDWTTGQFVYVKDDGTLIPMSESDNGGLTKNGEGYSNYFRTLAQSRSIVVPPLDSARVLLSVGSPMYIKVQRGANGAISYAGANIENTSDPNIDVYFDFAEMAILQPDNASPGIFVNTTRVDHFGFPLTLRVEGQGDKTVGEPVGTSRATIFDEFRATVPPEFNGLAQLPYDPYRIVAPAHASFRPGQINGDYLQSYIDSVWDKFRNEDLVFELVGLGQFRGRVNGDRFVFTGGNDNGTYYINGKPNTSEVLLGSGLLADPTGATDATRGTQLQIQAQLCAALNRHVAATPSDWYRQAAHYPAGLAANWYAKFWHDHAISGLAYGFAYDDVGDFSPSIHDVAPRKVTLTVGW